MALAVPDLVDFLLFLVLLFFDALELLLGVELLVVELCAFGAAGVVGAGVDCARTAAAVNSEVKIKRFIVSFSLSAGCFLPPTNPSCSRSRAAAITHAWEPQDPR